MVSIDEELNIARQAKVAIATLSTTAREATIGILREAYLMATHQIRNLFMRRASQ